MADCGMSDLFARFAPAIVASSEESIRADPTLGGKLLLDRSGALSVTYAPFEHVEIDARVVILGITPGLQQAANALVAARSALIGGRDPSAALAQAKVHASFSGPMRSNLTAMLDRIGLARALRLSSTDKLWDQEAGIGHFTSALRYPVLLNGLNYAGNPSMTNTPILLRYLEEYLRSEALVLRNAVWVPLGPKAYEAVHWLVSERALHNDRILAGLPHPSGANAERIAYFLGRKSRDSLSPKTNPDSIDRARSHLTKQVSALFG